LEPLSPAIQMQNKAAGKVQNMCERSILERRWLLHTSGMFRVAPGRVLRGANADDVLHHPLP